MVGVCRTAGPPHALQLPAAAPSLSQHLEGNPSTVSLWQLWRDSQSWGCCNYFLYCASACLLKPDKREGRGVWKHSRSCGGCGAGPRECCRALPSLSAAANSTGHQVQGRRGKMRARAGGDGREKLTPTEEYDSLSVGLQHHGAGGSSR